MPYIKLETTETVAADAKRGLCEKLSRLCAETIGKPEQYVQALVVDGVAMVHGGERGPAAFVDVRSIGGLGSKVCQGLAAKVCALLDQTLGVPGSRVYLNFTEVAAAKWGHDGSTFG
jgi:phenylpyruvate tautomerase